MVPKKLKEDDSVCVLALSRSIGGIMKYAGVGEADINYAKKRLEDIGLKVVFGEHVLECNEHLTASVASRTEDFHNALLDPSIKAIMAVAGGIGALQLVCELDYDLIANNPKIICGYSDIGHLCNAIFSETGLVCYYGPNFSSFIMRKGFDYSLEYFQKCLFSDSHFYVQPAEVWSDDNWAENQANRTFLPNDGYWPIIEGEATGTIIGGNCGSLNRLQGSEYFPSLKDTVIFLESPGEGKASLMALDSSIRSLTFQSGFENVKAIVIGRYSRNSQITKENLISLVKSIPGIANIPIIANVDFGHTTPVVTIPIGGTCKIHAIENNVQIKIITH